MRSPGAIVLGIFVFAVAGCSQTELEYHSNSYNRAIESSSNDQLLLNIVRASKDLPLHFTGTNKYVGAKLTASSFSPKVPFGREAPLNFDLGMKFDWSSGLSSIDMGNLNTEEALSRLSAEVSLSALDSILISGAPYDLVMTLLLEGMQVHELVYAAMKGIVRKECGPGSTPSTACDPIIEEARVCADGTLFSYKGSSFAREEFHQFVSRATSKCSYLKFQAYLAAFKIAGGSFELREKREEHSARRDARRPDARRADSRPSPAPNGKLAPQAVTKRQSGDSPKKKDGDEDGKKERQVVYEMHLHFRSKLVDDAYVAADNRLREKQLKAIEVRLRSPKRVIEYLGEITALQNYAKDRYSPTIRVGQGKSAFLFRLLRDDIAGNRPSILRVKGPVGETFVVPEPEYGSDQRDRTLVVLSITSHLVNLSIQKSALPSPAAVEVRPIQ